MTNEELNKLCCEFAALPTLAGHAFEHPEQNPTAGWCGICYKGRSVHEYPPVSTDWGAAGPLLDALIALRYTVIFHEGTYDCKISKGLHFWTSCADSATMALCLAVAELAKGVKNA